MINMLTELVVASTALAAPQQPVELTVPMQIVASHGAAGYRWATVRDAAGAPFAGRLQDGVGYTIAIGAAHGLRLTGLPEQEGAFTLQVDADDDGDFDEEPRQRCAFGEQVRVRIDRQHGPGVLGEVAYTLRANRDPDRDRFAVTAHYAAEGTVSYGGRTGFIRFVDGACDGLFDEKDFRTGTTMDLDRNGDGKVTDRGEKLTGSQIFEFGGAAWQVAAIEPDGSAVRLRRASIEIPQLGQPFPALPLRTRTGRDVPLFDRDRPLLLMLWASW